MVRHRGRPNIRADVAGASVIVLRTADGRIQAMHHYLGAGNAPSTETYCGGAMGFKDGIETLSADGKRRRAVLPGLSARDRALVNYFAIYPNFLLTLHPGYMMTIAIWPLRSGADALDRRVALRSVRVLRDCVPPWLLPEPAGVEFGPAVFQEQLPGV